jgi:hypothetical protein
LGFRWGFETTSNQLSEKNRLSPLATIAHAVSLTPSLSMVLQKGAPPTQHNPLRPMRSSFFILKIGKVVDQPYHSYSIENKSQAGCELDHLSYPPPKPWEKGVVGRVGRSMCFATAALRAEIWMFIFFVDFYDQTH